MAKITDPDSLAQTTDIVFDTTLKQIEVKSTGAISGTGTSASNGLTMQCLYSFAKEEWRTDSTLIKFPFPFDPITAEQFEMVNGWDFKNDSSRNLVRDAGWAVRNANGNISDMWANITTLGAFDAGTDQAYYQQAVAGAATDMDFAGEVNQAVQIYVDTNADGTPDTDVRGYFKIFLREEGKSFDSYDLISEQAPTNELGEVKMTYRKYAMPLSNGNDLNYLETDANIGTTTPYTDIDIEYLDGNNFYTTNVGTVALDDVIRDGATPGRWYICTGAGTIDATDYNDLGTMGGAGTATFSPYSGERQIGTNYYAFNVIVDGNVDDSGGNADKTEIYEKVQYSLRQNSDIDAGAGTVTGKTADDLMYFVGSELTTQPGVFVDDYLSNQVNDYTFYDIGGTARTFPFVAGVTINFDGNAQADTSGFRYVLFFTNDDAGSNAGADYGTSTAIIIKNNATTDIEGTATATAQVITDFDYDNNVQRGGGSAGTDVPYTAVGLGTDQAQFATVTGTLTATATNTINFVTAKERVYLNP